MKIKGYFLYCLLLQSIIGNGLAIAKRLPAIVEQASTLEFETIGIANQPSKIFAAFQEFAKSIPRRELLKLFRHPRALVRSYAAMYLVADLPSNPAAFYPLLMDDVSIATLDGDELRDFNLAQWVMNQFCLNKKSIRVRPLLERASVDLRLTKSIREGSSKCLARQSETEYFLAPPHPHGPGRR